AEPSVAFRSAKVADPREAKDNQKTVVDSPRPNFVFILLDDLGWQGLHCFGDTFFETPRIDRLAAEGMKFTDAYSACHVCSPTRASIMTGQYPARLHLTDYIPGREEPFAKLRQPEWSKQLPRDATTLAEALKPLGYASASIGKWHLGGLGSQPTDRGFDVSFGDPLGGGQRSMFWPYGRPRVDGIEGQYLTDHVTDEAIKFIDANRDKPFFLYLSHYAVHNPVEAKADRVERYRAKLDPSDKQHDPTYAAMIDSVDESTGRVLDRLEELGIDDRTIVIFVSDNGPLKPYSRPSPLRESKGTIYEGGIRVPMIVRWPGVVRPGSVCGVPVSSVDFFPTILEIAGAKPREVDGESLVPLFKQEGQLERDAIYWHYPHYSNHLMPPFGAIRQGDFKLVELYEDGQLQLFNLKDDLGETRNLAGAMPEKTKELHAKLEAWRKSVGAQRMTPNPDYDPAKTQWNRRKGRVINIYDMP
ncbi:MAG TPA: sulfatase, partial [Planctomycetaceae bacterium]|nr:sulfatase [Planctomycetaceae bacterium]